MFFASEVWNKTESIALTTACQKINLINFSSRNNLGRPEKRDTLFFFL